MKFTRSCTTTLYEYYIFDLKIVRVDDIVDLGFKLSRTLTPSLHIAMISCISFKVVGFLMRLSKDFKLIKSLKFLYCALVRPILEYGSII
jgi:hypothetical protein